MDKILKITVFYMVALFQGICIVLIPAASFILKSSDFNAITDQQYGLIFLPMISMAIVTTMIFNKLLHKTGPQRVFYLGLSGHVLYLLTLGVVNLSTNDNQMSFFALLTANAFFGAGFGLLLSSLNLFVVELFPDHRNAVLTGLHSFIGIGAALAPLIVSFFYQRGSWAGSVLFSFIYVTFFTVICLLVAAPKISVHDPQDVDRPALLSKPKPLPWGAKCFLVTIVVYGIAESILSNWTTVYLSQNKGFSIQTASIALSVFWGFITLGRIFASFAALKIEARLLYRVSPLLIIASILAILLVKVESRVIFFYAAAGFGCSYFFPLSIGLSTKYFDSWRKRLASLSVAAIMLGVGIGSSAIGVLRDRHLINLDQAFMIAIGCAMTIGVTAFILTTHRSGKVPCEG